MKYYRAYREKLAAGDPAGRPQHPGPDDKPVTPGDGDRCEPGSSRDEAREEPRKPRKPSDPPAPSGFLGFLGSPPAALDDDGSGHVPFGGAAEPPRPAPCDSWRAALETWPEEQKEAWEERAASLEYDAGFARESAERTAFESVAARLARDGAATGETSAASSDPWDRMIGYLKWLGFTEVDPAELDAYAVVPSLDEEFDDGPWRCRNRYCHHKGRWWKSIHGVVNCLNCCPPASPNLVTETGGDDP